MLNDDFEALAFEASGVWFRVNHISALKARVATRVRWDVSVSWICSIQPSVLECLHVEPENLKS